MTPRKGLVYNANDIIFITILAISAGFFAGSLYGKGWMFKSDNSA